MAKQVKKIIEYQKIIRRLLSQRGYDLFEIENVCLCQIGHIACFESFVHAIEDLLANGTINKVGNAVFIKQ